MCVCVIGGAEELRGGGERRGHGWREGKCGR
jgi:hypothetical protein